MSLAVGFSLEKTIVQHQSSQSQTEELKIQTAQLKAQLQDLENQVITASHSATHEKILRDELLLQKPGEYLVKIELESTSQFNSTTHQLPPTPWEEWRQLLF